MGSFYIYLYIQQWNLNQYYVSPLYIWGFLKKIWQWYRVLVLVCLRNYFWEEPSYLISKVFLFNIGKRNRDLQYPRFTLAHCNNILAWMWVDLRRWWTYCKEIMPCTKTYYNTYLHAIPMVGKLGTALYCGPV